MKKLILLFAMLIAINSMAQLTTVPPGNIVVGGSTLLGSYGSTDRLVQIQGSTQSWLGLRSINAPYWFEIGSGTSSGANILYSHGSKLVLSADGARVTILNTNGYVGIATSSPDAPLTVNGLIHAKEVKVDLSVPGPDYVFDKGYNLLSLTALSEYIEKNRHLPETPSAVEMESGGIQLSVMNMLLLKKVEELTLHMIELDKRIKELENHAEKKSK